jgi:periplasmic divalent cation tolerance protein
MLSIAWTTTAQRADAELLAKGLVTAGLASCVQIDGPIRSVYRWADRIEEADEYRLTVKVPTPQLAAAEAYVLQNHPYETPEWVAVPASRVAEKYLSWSQSVVQSDRFQP